MAVFAVTTLTAVYLEIVHGFSAQQTGLLLLMQPVLMVVLSPFTGRLSDKVGSRVLAALGMVLVSAGMVQLAYASSSTGRLLIALATIGVGMAVFVPRTSPRSWGSVDRSQLSLASRVPGDHGFTGQGLSVAVLARSPPEAGARGAR
jgi:MFS family permease